MQMSNLVKQSDQPMIWDENQYDWFVSDFLSLGEQIISDLDRPQEDLYRKCIEFQRAELKRVCAALLNKLAGTDDKTLVTPTLFRVPS
jgi:hypothetical protein